MRIIIAHNYTDTSFSVISWSLANHLATNGHEILFFSHHPHFEEPIQPQPRLKVIGWPEKRPTGIKSFLFYYKEHKRFKPDLVIIHFAPMYIAGIAAWLLRCPNRWVYYHTAEAANIADTAPSAFTHKLRCIRRQLLYKFYTRIVCVSHFAAEDIQRYFGVPKNKLQVVYNALPDRWNGNFDKPSTAPIRFHFLGRLDPCKRVVEMTDAFIDFIKQTGANAVLQIAGNGLITEAIKAKAKQNENIVYKGAIPYDGVDDFITEAHWLVCPSLVETFGMVNAEAMMNATPVLASNAGGIPEIVIDGETGFLSVGFEEEDWVKLFESASRFLKEDHAAYKAMQEACRKKYIENFSIPQYLAVFDSLISECRK